MHKLQPIHQKLKQKQIMHESNKLCMLQAGRKKAIRSVKKNKNSFINFLVDKFAMSIRWGKLTI